MVDQAPMMAAPIQTSPVLKPSECLERTVSEASTDAGLFSILGRTVSQDTTACSEAAQPESPGGLWGGLEDGPALTADGSALDLDGGVAIFFSCGEELSESHEAKLWAKERARALRAVQLAHAFCEAEARVDRGEVCGVDPQGTVHGAAALGSPLAGHASGERPKVLLRKRRAAAARRLPNPSFKDGSALCPDAQGRVSVYLYLDRDAARGERKRRRLAARAAREAQDPEVEVKVLILEPTGTIRGCRKLSKAPPVIVSC